MDALSLVSLTIGCRQLARIYVSHIKSLYLLIKRVIASQPKCITDKTRKLHFLKGEDDSNSALMIVVELDKTFQFES